MQSFVIIFWFLINHRNIISNKSWYKCIKKNFPLNLIFLILVIYKEKRKESIEKKYSKYVLKKNAYILTDI